MNTVEVEYILSRTIPNPAGAVGPCYNAEYDIDVFGYTEGPVTAYRRSRATEDNSVVSVSRSEPPNTKDFYSLYEWFEVPSEQTTESDFSRWSWLANSWDERFIRLAAINRAGTDNSLIPAG